MTASPRETSCRHRGERRGAGPHPAFPHAAFGALEEAGALTPPPDRADEWPGCATSSKADGSVGRIFEGHLNAYERLDLEGIDPEDTCSASGAPTHARRGRAAKDRGDELHGSKVFCSGAGGLDRALVIAKGTPVYVDLHET